MVRAALGENAIIVATREEESGGVRVTAAIDDNTPRSALTSLPPQDDKTEGTEALETIADALTRHHVPRGLSEKLMATATQFASDDPLLALGAAIDTHFKFLPIKDNDTPLMLVGPPGAGKTLTIAKLATKATLAKHPPTVISTDLERAGGMEQLAVFTRLLKLNLVEIEDWQALRDMVGMQQGNLIYIDTPGLNAFSSADRDRIRDTIGAIGNAIVTLPAGMDAAEAIDMAQEFHRLGASRLIFTRLDMLRRMGSILRIAHECGMPLANACASAKVTEPPTPMNAVALARLLLQDKRSPAPTKGAKP